MFNHIVLGSLLLSLGCLGQDDMIDVTGIEGKSITLKCDTSSLGSQEDVEWVDRVYNSQPEPQRIFYTHKGISHLDSSHPNADNYKVNSHQALKISHLSHYTDPGQYICRTKSKHEDHRVLANYYLSVSTMPNCFGETSLREHGDTNLVCNMSYSGSQPDLTWTREGEEIASIDKFDIRKAERVVKVKATHRDDGAVYQCDVNFGALRESCSFTLNVTYHVRDLKIHPERDTIEVGHEIRCTAKGNPAPAISLEPEGGGSTSGMGWRAMLVEDSWVGQEIKVSCSASNTVNGRPETLTEETIYRIKAQTSHEKKTPDKRPNNEDKRSSNSGDSENNRPSNEGKTVIGNTGSGNNTSCLAILKHHLLLSVVSYLLARLVLS